MQKGANCPRWGDVWKRERQGERRCVGGVCVCVCVVARLPQFLQPWSFDVTFFECNYNNPIVLLGFGKSFPFGNHLGDYSLNLKIFVSL